MKKYSLLAVIAALPIILAGCTYGSSNSNANVNSSTTTIDLTNTGTNLNANINSAANLNTATTNTNATTASLKKSITVTSSGFSPSPVTVTAGTVVTWTNSSGSDVRIASDPHPTHTDLPGLDSGTLANGGTYSFTFTQVGTWGYHNHLDPTQKGTVTVQ